jgi:hypothetical protein
MQAFVTAQERTWKMATSYLNEKKKNVWIIRFKNDVLLITSYFTSTITKLDSRVGHWYYILINIKI